MTDGGREWLAAQARPATAREQIVVAIAMIDALERQLAPIDTQLRGYARRQRGCRVDGAVRYAGLDITVHQSDRRRAPGHLSRQGPPALRWALFESALCASRSGSPDHDYYRQPDRRARRRHRRRGWPWRASCSSAATTRCANSARRR